MMFAQANSEHCRHKLFNTKFNIDNVPQEYSLFSMIKNTYKQNPQNILSAYSDNAAVFQGNYAENFYVDNNTNRYVQDKEYLNIVIKAETHNHPTAIAPFEGAATGSGGEIRDEGATGIGGIPKAALTGFSVSNLFNISKNFPSHIASPKQIMLDGPIGAARFNNEFGRPAISGYFRSFEYKNYGYHKPVMLAGGMGYIKDSNILKHKLAAGDLVIVIGGPGYLIGLGGGSASSSASNTANAKLDYASVQRGAPEMERRCQEFITTCANLGQDNPIKSIHDVGAGGLANAIPELVAEEDNLGVAIDINKIPVNDKTMTAMEIWCNESQERYVLVISENKLDIIKQIAKRENCPLEIIGEITVNNKIELLEHNGIKHTDFSKDVLFGKPPIPECSISSKTENLKPFILPNNLDLKKVLLDVLKHPTVASKSYLITIGDRSITGCVARQQMVGPWQVPVGNYSATLTDFIGYSGEVMAIGERAPISIISSTNSVRMAVGELITNLAASGISAVSQIKLSVNWMVAANNSEEKYKLYQACQELGLNLCPKLGLVIPVGKDSVSMQTTWQQGLESFTNKSPVTAIISGFAKVSDVRLSKTPQLINKADTSLIFIDLARGAQRLGASIFGQNMAQIGNDAPDLESEDILTNFVFAINELNINNKILAYHDRSDGGLFTTICEMAFAGNVGVEIDLTGIEGNIYNILLNEELGCVIQIDKKNIDFVFTKLYEYGLEDCYIIGSINNTQTINIFQNDNLLFQESRVSVQRVWQEPSYIMQAVRDNEELAKQEFDNILDEQTPGLFIRENDIDFNFNINHQYKPKIAIIREQGTNGQREMAAAFTAAGFDSYDVHINDLLTGSATLLNFNGLVICGGFSYGDVLGAGRGLASRILNNSILEDMFYKFFNNTMSFSLGVCNGCQVLSKLTSIIPGADNWPKFKTNQSEQFEGRLSMVEVYENRSVLMQSLIGSKLPIAVAHGEGRVVFDTDTDLTKLSDNNQVVLGFINNYGGTATTYPANPNGSVNGVTGFCNTDGRINIMMPHPERVFRNIQLGLDIENGNEYSPWFAMFQSAYAWLV